MNNTLTELRSVLFDTLAGLKSGKLELDRAKAINETAQIVINSAKVEVDYLRLTHQESNFLGGAGTLPDPACSKTATGTKTVVARTEAGTITQHRMRG